MFVSYPPPAPAISAYTDDRVRNKMSLRSVISNGEEASRPFYLYKGLDPQKEEALKIYPVNDIRPVLQHPSISPCSSFSSSSSSSILTYPIKNSISGYSLPSPPSSISKSRADSFNLFHRASTGELPHPHLQPPHTLSPSTSSSSISNSDIDDIDHESEHDHDHDHEHDHESEDDNTEMGNENELIKEIRSGIENDRVKYKCNYTGCHYKGTFLSKDYLRRHIREQHRRSKEHICKGFHSNGEKWGCNKKFSRPYQLVNHWRGQRSLKRCGVPLSELRRCGIQ